MSSWITLGCKKQTGTLHVHVLALVTRLWVHTELLGVRVALQAQYECLLLPKYHERLGDKGCRSIGKFFDEEHVYDSNHIGFCDFLIHNWQAGS